MILSLAGCTTDRARLEAAATVQGDASVTAQAIAQARRVPDQPKDCGAKERSGVQVGDRLDVALVKTDAALSRANARGRRCARWYEDLKRSRNAP